MIRTTELRLQRWLEEGEHRDFRMRRSSGKWNVRLMQYWCNPISTRDFLGRHEDLDQAVTLALDAAGAEP